MHDEGSAPFQNVPSGQNVRPPIQDSNPFRVGEAVFVTHIHDACLMAHPFFLQQPVGVIRYVESTGEGMYAVEFETSFEGGHRCADHCTPLRGQWFHRTSLERLVTSSDETELTLAETALTYEES